jgi:hypothetical protein
MMNIRAANDFQLMWTGSEVGSRQIPAKSLEVNGKRHDAGALIGVDWDPSNIPSS